MYNVCHVAQDGSFLFLLVHWSERCGCLMQRVAYAKFCRHVCHCSLSLMYDALDVNIPCVEEMCTRTVSRFWFD
jgi:hypothetical protein